MSCVFRERMLEVWLHGNMWFISLHGECLKGSGLRNGPKYMSIWSIKRKKKKKKRKTPLWEPAGGEKKCGQFPRRRSLRRNCTAIPPTQHATIHQWLLQSYWAFTRHIHIPDKRNKKHFRATLPTVPTLFHLSNAYKTVVDGQILLWGTTDRKSVV